MDRFRGSQSPLPDSTAASRIKRGTIAAGEWELAAIFLLLLAIPPAEALGSMAGLAATYPSPRICGIVPGLSGFVIDCRDSSLGLANITYARFVGLSGGMGFFCGLREWTMQPFCWDATTLVHNRISSASYSQISVGESHACGIRSLDGGVDCWRGAIAAPPPGLNLSSITSGSNFSCGISAANASVVCWGDDSIASAFPRRAAFSSVHAGARHVCGLYSSFGAVTYCWGDNTYGQLDFPPSAELFAFALGHRHSCGLDRATRFALCWGDNSSSQLAAPPGERFDSIAAGDFYTCGVRSLDLDVVCWGGAFAVAAATNPSNGVVGIGLRSLPGACGGAICAAEEYNLVNASGISSVCGGSNYVCVSCTKCPEGAVELVPCGINGDRQCSTPPLAPPPVLPPPGGFSRRRRRRLSTVEIVSVVLGSTGMLLGLVSAACCSWSKLRKRSESGRIHHSVNANNGSVTISQQQQLRRQRSGASYITGRSNSRRSLGRADAFLLEELAAATDNFSDENRIGTGSFGSVYRGVLPDGREVAIKRGGIGSSAMDTIAKKRFQDKEAAFQSELEFLTRLHHRHLVTLVGFCAEDDERLLVYDFMPNGTLHDHLHGRKEGDHRAEQQEIAPAQERIFAINLNSWQMRVGIALQAARGIEYLHTYAMPPIIHRDIKSSNILIDSQCSARVSDFGLSLMGPSDGESHLSLTAAGTVGYMDPEYYRLQQLTTKSDVYSFGVVLLEILTGKRAIIVENRLKLRQNPQLPVNVVDFAVPFILAGQVTSILDPRIPVPEEASEIEAVLIVAELAEQCVRLEGRERPQMSEIVNRLENAVEVFSRGDRRRKKKQLRSSSNSSSSGPL